MKKLILILVALVGLIGSVNAKSIVIDGYTYKVPETVEEQDEQYNKNFKLFGLPKSSRYHLEHLENKDVEKIVKKYGRACCMWPCSTGEKQAAVSDYYAYDKEENTFWHLQFVSKFYYYHK